MLSGFLLDAILTPINWVLGLLDIPIVNPLEIPEGVYDTLCLICQQAGYLLPIRLFVSILIFDFAVTNFHVIWSLIVKIKGFLS